jgi:hypothetical protein
VPGSEEEADPSPIRASRGWSQDDNENKGSGKKGSGKKGRRPTLRTEGSGTRNDNGNSEGNCNCEREEGPFAALRMTAKSMLLKWDPSLA